MSKDQRPFDLCRPDLDRVTNTGDTILHYCVLYNRTECIKLVLKTRPQLAKKANYSGKSPLDVATEMNHETCVELVRTYFCLNSLNASIFLTLLQVAMYYRQVLQPNDIFRRQVRIYTTEIEVSFIELKFWIFNSFWS